MHACVCARSCVRCCAVNHVLSLIISGKSVSHPPHTIPPVVPLRAALGLIVSVFTIISMGADDGWAHDLDVEEYVYLPDHAMYVGTPPAATAH